MIRRVSVARVAVAVIAATTWLLPRPFPAVRPMTVDAQPLGQQLLGQQLQRLQPIRPRQQEPKQETPACRATGRVVLPRKLVCANENVEVRFVFDPVCGDGSDAGAIRHLRLSHDLPPGVVLVAGCDPCQVGPSQTAHWSLDLPSQSEGRVEAGHAVMAMRTGLYELGGATVDITDRNGKVWPSKLSSATLVVSTCSTQPGVRPQALYLPIAIGPGCPAADRPTDVVLAVDRSASMDGGGLGDAIGRGAEFLDRLDLRVDRVAVLGFDSQVDVLVPLTDDRAAVAAALAGITPRQGTRIDRALTAARDLLVAGDPTGARRRALVVLTDGVQIGPGGDAAVVDAARAAHRAGVTVMAIGLGPAPNWPLLRAIADGPPASATGRTDSRLDDALYSALSALRCGR